MKVLFRRIAARLAHVRVAFAVIILMLAIALSTMVMGVNRQLANLHAATANNAAQSVLQLQTDLLRLELSWRRMHQGQPDAVADFRQQFESFAAQGRDMQMADAFNQLEDVSWYRFGVYHLTMLISGLSREVRRSDADLADDPVVEILIFDHAPKIRTFALTAMQAFTDELTRPRIELEGLLRSVAALGTLMLASLAAAVIILAQQTRFLRLREQALADSEGRLSATIRATHDAVIVHDQEGRIIEFNTAAERMTGRARVDVMGEEFARIFLPRDLQELYKETVSLAAQEGTGQRVEMDVRHANGAIFPADIAVGATEGGNGMIFALNMRDITTQKQEAAALRAALEGAEEATRTKARFLAMMSHEIRTPLNGVLGALHLLDGTELESEQRLYVTTATRSGEALLTLISDILDFSKMEAGKLELDLTDFPLATLFDDVRGILDPAARRGGNELVISPDPSLPSHVTGDLGRLRQILLNFGSNAVKFTNHGKVEITARITGGEPDHPRIEFAVIDNGIGIPRHRLDDLFKEFSMLDASYRRKVSGTGLGLAISQRLARLMGGEVGVDSVEGLGSRFWISVPMAVAAAINPASLPERDARPRASLSILLVEDNPTNLMVASRMLTSEGHHITTAKDGLEAVEAARTGKFDVVLMDISMPELDGLEATRRIRKLASPHGRVPIVAMTAHAIAEDRQRFLEAGMDNYLTKPVRRQQLLAVLAHVEAGVLKGANKAESVPDALERLPLVDAGDFKILESDMSPEAMPVVLNQFVEEMLTRQREAEAAAISGAHDAFRKAVHAVAGSASTVGARKLAGMAQALERECLQGSPMEAAARIADFSELLSETAATLRAMLPREKDSAAA